MPRLHAALLGALTLVVLAMGVVLISGQQESTDRLEEIACLERIHATAAVAGIVPDERIDVDGRLEAVRTLSEQLDDC